MYYKFNPTKDVFIDSSSINHNFGKDELLEIGVYKNNDNKYFPINSLIQFDINDINNKITNSIISNSANFELKLYECSSYEQLYDGFYIDIYLVSQSWNEGTGSRAGYSLNGNCNWISASVNSWTNPGGDVIPTPTASQYFITSSGDLSIDVTELVGLLTGSIYTNYGFLLKFRNNNINRKYFYSSDTHTIYAPRLYAKWDDSIVTGSYSIADNDWIIKPNHIKNKYKQSEKTKFEFFIRQRNPILTYSTESIYSLSNTALNNLYYQVKDIKTNETIIPFSDYTKISYSGSQNYFYLNMNPLEQFRTYKLELKHEKNDNEINYYDIGTFVIED